MVNKMTLHKNNYTKIQNEIKERCHLQFTLCFRFDFNYLRLKGAFLNHVKIVKGVAKEGKIMSSKLQGVP